MTIKPSLLGHFFFFFLGAWLVSTIFIDFFAVMAVFKNVSNIFEAGTVGMYVFGSFNKFEMIFGSCISAITFFNPLPQKKVKALMIGLSLILLFIALYYNFFLSPRISSLTYEMHDIGLGNKGYETTEVAHGLYHKRYIFMDSIKLLFLFTLLCLGIGKGNTFSDTNIKENTKEITL
jgi:hypothetical protein